MITQTQRVWVLLADASRARLLRVHKTDGGSCHIDELESLIDRWEPHEHFRPSPLHADNGHAALPFHEDEEMRLRYAKDVAAWVDRLVRHYQIQRLTVFSPSRFLGDLRRSWRSNGHLVEEHEAELIHLTRAQLSDHPAIRKLVGATRR